MWDMRIASRLNFKNGTRLNITHLRKWWNNFYIGEKKIVDCGCSVQKWLFYCIVSGRVHIWLRAAIAFFFALMLLLVQVPVQRVTKYPLLLARLYKVTPEHHVIQRELLKEARHHIELHLEHINSVIFTSRLFLNFFH